MDTAFGSFDEDAVSVFRVARDDKIRAVGEFHGDPESHRRIVDVVLDRHSVAVIDVEYRLFQVVGDRHFIRSLTVEDPEGAVHMMRSPVGDLSSGVLEPPPEREMMPAVLRSDLQRVKPVGTSAGEEFLHGCLTLPHFPIERFRDRCRSDDRGFPSAVRDARDALDLAENAFPDHQSCGRELVFHGTLHRTDLEDLAVLRAGFADQLVFFERQRQRFFTENVLACLHRFHGDLRVPMVRRADAYHVDVVALEDPAVVFVRVRLEIFIAFPASDLSVQSTLKTVDRIDVAECRNVGNAVESMRIPVPLRTKTHAGCTDPF